MAKMTTMTENTTPRLTPTAQRILARIRADGSIRRQDLPMRSGGYWTAEANAIENLKRLGLIVQEPTPEHAGHVQYVLAPAVA